MSKNNNPCFDDLEAVKNDYPDRDYKINIEIPEFNCVCPQGFSPS